MAHIKIDLLPKEAGEIKKVNQTLKWLRRVSQVLLVVFILVIVVLFSWFFITQSQVTQVKAQVEAAKAQLEQSSQEELKYRLYQEILNRADKLIKERKDFKGIFDDLYAQLPPGVTVKALSFDKELVIFEGDASGIQAFATSISNFSNAASNSASRFKEIALTTVSRGADGHYIFRMEISLKTP